MEIPEMPETPAETSRRQFLQASIFVLMGVGAAAVAPPLAVSFVGPSLRTSEGNFTQVGPVANIPSGRPCDMQFMEKTTDAYLAETEMRSVWVIKGSGDELTVFSPICPHLGCQYDWDSAKNQFHCPCHGSIFALDGKVLGGPAPRPLDTLPHEVTNGELFVKWERFKLGISQKVQA